MEEKNKEKRKYPRLAASFIVSYRQKDIPDNYELTQTKNISKGGFLITTNRAFPKGSGLAITVRFPFLPKKIDILGEVVESKEIVRDIIYDTRIRIIEIDKEYLEKLADYINQSLKLKK